MVNFTLLIFYHNKKCKERKIDEGYINSSGNNDKKLYNEKLVNQPEG